mgnify:CR=1 FL=1
MIPTSGNLLDIVGRTPAIGRRVVDLSNLLVDAMLIANNDGAELRKLKRSLHKKISMKELKEAQYILGMRIK